MNSHDIPDLFLSSREDLVRRADFAPKNPSRWAAPLHLADGFLGVKSASPSSRSTPEKFCAVKLPQASPRSSYGCKDKRSRHRTKSIHGAYLINMKQRMISEIAEN